MLEVLTFITATGGTPCAGVTCGNYKIHTFTGPGTFCVSQLAPVSLQTILVDYVTVAGGGGGGSGLGSGGGGAGAGGFRDYLQLTIVKRLIQTPI